MCCHISEQCRHRTLSASQRSVHLEHSLLEKFIRRVSTPLIVPLLVTAQNPAPNIGVFGRQGCPIALGPNSFSRIFTVTDGAIPDNWPSRLWPICWLAHNDYSSRYLPRQEAEGILRRPLGLWQPWVGVA